MLHSSITILVTTVQCFEDKRKIFVILVFILEHLYAHNIFLYIFLETSTRLVYAKHT